MVNNSALPVFANIDYNPKYNINSRQKVSNNII
ncbi:hypothetical protein A1019T_00260 [Psychrobacter pasteurii]|uniref:Uncharacterized protein n=1 Tax=Psychrobacter pasteurii TaxID=1945520 RepID=A0A1R4ED09_9GAMM|nr:hypothetical protein A1019T_00260 [Psychrobacter pasteurii]